MSYHLDQQDGSIVIDGFEQGIGDSPYGTSIPSAGFSGGMTDMRNVNVITVPGEASVNFSTTQNSLSSFSGSVASADASADTITYSGETGTPAAGMAMVFAGGSLPTGVSAGTQSAAADTNVYWIGNILPSPKTFQLFTDPGLGSLVNITGNGTGTFATINIGQTRHSTTNNASPGAEIYYCIDANGRVWYQNSTKWVFTGNITRASANGNGLVYYRGYLFAFRNSKIDYMPGTSLGTWTYGWQPDGSNDMNTAVGIANSHHALVGQDDTVYFCDSSYLGSFFQKVGSTFNPGNVATYTAARQALALPSTEIAQWLAELGVTLLTIGVRNYVYPWDRTSTSFKYPILLSDTGGYANMASANPNCPKMITVNTNTFIFTGTRGRIYITNGSQAQLYKKVPDHLSGTVEPYFAWGGIGYNKNQLYFGLYATTNGGVANTNYGGVWAIDLDTKALRLTNELSYGSFAGYMTMYIPLPAINTTGSGFYAGWDNGSSGYGIDGTASTPYSSGQAYVISDLIPVGTFIRPKTFTQLEYKLSTPLVSGESVQLLMGSNLTGTFTSVGTDSTVGNISFNWPITLQGIQWLKVKAILTSTASTPSYVRLKELRIY